MTRDEFESFFEAHKIDCSKPGFYNDPNFIAIEKKRPCFLESYAEYINTLSFSPYYLDQSEAVIIDVSKYIYEKLEQDGIKGVCLDVCNIISQILERLDIWNYVVKGGLAIHFNRIKGLSPIYLAPVMLRTNPAVLGHSWIVAPPFRVVDTTFPFQPYPPEYSQHIQGMVLEKEVTDSEPEIYDILDMDSVQFFKLSKGRNPNMNDAHGLLPHLKVSFKKYGVFKVKKDETTLKYTSCGISTSDGTLETISNITLCGKSPIELYREYISKRH